MTKGDDNNDHRPKPDYEIGYGRPPEKTQFKPGQSGNPKGRKRKPKSVQAQMQAVLLRKVPINERGKTKHLPLQEVILRNLANKAAQGDLKAVAFVFNLRNSPQFSDTDTIDENSLSSDDQAMFDEVMRQFLGPRVSDQTALSGPTDHDITASEPLPLPEANHPQARRTSSGEEEDDG